MVAPSFSDLYDIGRTEMVLRRPDLFVEPGDVTDFLISAGAAGADYAVGYAVRRFASLFLDTAKGDDLTTLADDRYGITRFAASKSVGSVTLSRATVAAGAGTIPAGSIVATGFDNQGRTIEFQTTAAVTFSAVDLTRSVSCEAVTAGPSGNVAPGLVTRVVSTLFDPTITVTNAARMAGGADEEGDDSLRERVRQFPSVIRGGTIAALEYGAKQVPGVVAAKVAEDSSGIATLYVADGSGGSNAELNAKVELEIKKWRAAGCPPIVASAEPLPVAFVFSVLAKPGYYVADSLPAIQEAVRARVAKFTMGETCFLDSIRHAVIALDERIQRLTFYSPSSDVTPLAHQVVQAESITVTAASP